MSNDHIRLIPDPDAPPLTNAEAHMTKEKITVPPTWRNVALERRPVRAGELISMEIKGGFVNRPAPCDGTVYRLAGPKSDPRDVFVPKDVERGAVFVLPPIPKHKP